MDFRRRLGDPVGAPEHQILHAGILLSMSLAYLKVFIDKPSSRHSCPTASYT
jgi:hypothetical protein